MFSQEKKKYSSVKDIREREKAYREIKIKEQCEKIAFERYGQNVVIQWSNENKGLWYLPVLDDQENVQYIAILKPIDRGILSYASTKIEDEGLYAFLEQCMRECWVAGDDCILEEEEYFIPSAMKFNAILEGRKVMLLKR